MSSTGFLWCLTPPEHLCAKGNTSPSQPRWIKTLDVWERSSQVRGTSNRMQLNSRLKLNPEVLGWEKQAWVRGGDTSHESECNQTWDVWEKTQTTLTMTNNAAHGHWPATSADPRQMSWQQGRCWIEVCGLHCVCGGHLHAFSAWFTMTAVFSPTNKTQ